MLREPGSPAAVLLDSVQRALQAADCLAGPDVGAHSELWGQLRQMGVADAHLPEFAEQLGEGWGLLAEAARLCGRHGARVPLAHNAVADWLAAGHDLAEQLPRGRTALSAWPVPAGALAQDGHFSAQLRDLDWPHPNEEQPQALLAVVRNPPREDGSHWGSRLALVDIAGVQPDLAANLADEPRASLDLQGAKLLAWRDCPEMAGQLPLAMLALLRASAMAGAMESAVVLALEHVQTREQFGRKLAKFQAIQQQLAAASVQAVSVAATCAWAARRLDMAGAECARKIAACAIAKSRADRAVAEVLDAAHQSHGAIGFTQEYALGRFSRRLWSWRTQDGDAAHWNRHLGAAARRHAAAAQAPGGLWDYVTAL